MAYNPNLANASSFFNSGNIQSQPIKERVFARVVDIVLDESHQDFNEFGKLDAINGIRYKVLRSNQDETDPQNLPFAYCGESILKRIPLIDEVVEIVNEPSNSVNETSYSTRDYYIKPLNLWNNAHHNALPDIINGKTEAKLGKDVVEREDIATLQPFPGDLYVEGRLGQSIRLSGYKHPKNIFTDDSNNGQPLTIIRVGQDPEADIFKNYVENVNTDDASIYMTSNHTIPLTQSSDKRDTYRDTKPDDLNIFQGRQVIIDSGRVVLHAKDDHLLLNSVKSIGLSSTTVNIDSSEYLQLDSPSMYLGARAEQPVLKGDQSVDLLRNLLDILLSMAQVHSQAKLPELAEPQMVAASAEMRPKLQNLKSQLDSLKSKKVFTE